VRLLVVEDDQTLNRQIVTALEQAGYAVDKAYDGEEGQFLGETEPYDAIILDLGLPKVDGVSVLTAWRREERKVPVIILTARDRWSDKVQGFDAGADDYVTKPFHMEELLARVRALLRRSAGAAAPPPAKVSEVRVGTCMLDLERRLLVRPDGSEDALTASEFDLLKLFVSHPNRPLTRDWLLESSSHREADAFDRAIDNRILRLRRKLEADPAKPEAIRSVRGVGYMFVPPRE
jgi:two-component system OmpR family response regulator